MSIEKRMKEDERKDPASLPAPPPWPLGPLRWADMTAEERHIARSLKIRRRIYAFLDLHVEHVFLDMEDLANQAANASMCSSETAKRWVRQFTAPGSQFEIREQTAGLVIWRRGEK